MGHAVPRRSPLPLSHVGAWKVCLEKAMVWPGWIMKCDGQTGGWGKGLDSQFSLVSTVAEEEDSN